MSLFCKFHPDPFCRCDIGRFGGQVWQVGFKPIVFFFESGIGGVWAKTIKTTRFQLPKAMYQFFDFSWPGSVTDDFPTQQEMIEYICSYATYCSLMSQINSHVNPKSYSPVPIPKMIAVYGFYRCMIGWRTGGYVCFCWRRSQVNSEMVNKRYLEYLIFVGSV